MYNYLIYNIIYSTIEIKAEYAPLRLLLDYGLKSYHDGEMDQLTASIIKLQIAEAAVRVCLLFRKFLLITNF